jgi:peptidyl-prolyl cis-trans isomerase C
LNRLKFHLLSLALLAGSAIALSQGEAATPNSAPAAAAPNHQAATPAAPSSATPQNPGSTPQGASTLPAEAPVITIAGVCDVSPNGLAKTTAKTTAAAKTRPSAQPSTAAAHTDCKTQITRAEFEKLMKTVAPSAPPAARRQIATRYVQFLTAANEGVKLGVDKDPDFSEQLALMRLQLLAQDAERKMQAQAANISDAELKAYYDQNPSAFEEVTLTRIFVPQSSTEPAQGQQHATKEQQSPGVPQAPGQQQTSKPEQAAGQQQAADPKAVADNARQQLAASGDPDKIQKTVFEQLKTSTEPPSTKFGAKRRGSLPPAHEQKLFSLKPGDVSEVIPDSVGYVIYRVDAKQQVPFEQVKDEVKRRLMQQRIEDVRQKMQQASKAGYNDAYFGAEGAKAGAPAGVPPSRPEPPKPGNSAAATGSNPAAQSQPANPKK